MTKIHVTDESLGRVDPDRRAYVASWSPIAPKSERVSMGPTRHEMTRLTRSIHYDMDYGRGIISFRPGVLPPPPREARLTIDYVLIGGGE